MSQDLSNVIPQLLAQGLLALRQNCVMPQLVNRSYEDLAGRSGSTIDVPIPSAITATAVTPSATPPSTPDVVPTQVAITLDQWYEAPFYMTDKDLMEVQAGTIPMIASEAIKALANNVDSYLLALGAKFYGYYGTAGTTPFGDGTTIDATRIATILNKQLAPIGDRNFVLNADAQGNAMNVRAFQDTSWSGDPSVIQAGQLNNKLGFRWWMDQNVPVHTSGTITTGLIAKAVTVQAIGDKTIVCTTAASTGACALLVGDIVTFAGHNQTYVLTAVATQASAASDVTLAIEPGLVVALAGSEAVSVKASHAMNLGFHRDAIAFATRPLEGSNHPASFVMAQTDPVSKLTLRLEVSREYKRDRYSFDVLYGAEVVRRELGARLAG